MESKKKKDEVVIQKSILGREGSSLKIGIIGLPNVGKRTTFSLLKQMQIPSDSSKDETKAKVEVPDPRYNKLGDLLNKKKTTPVSLNVVSVIELVTGGYTGDGLGIGFLSQLPALDAIFHVLRAFEDEDVQHNLGDVDPIRDLDIVHAEFIEKDKIMAEKYIADADKILKRTPLDKDAKEEKIVLEKVIEVLKNNQTVRNNKWVNKEIDILNKYLFLSSKPVVYLINISEQDYAKKKNKWLAKIAAWVKSNGDGKMVPYSVSYELKLQNASPEEKEKIVQEAGTESGLGKITTTGYSVLDLIHYFTVGEEEIKSWNIRKETKNPEAAGAIHPNYEKRFISGDVIKADDLLKLGSEEECKKQGLCKNEGRNYEVQDGDVIDFKFSAADVKKK